MSNIERLSDQEVLDALASTTNEPPVRLPIGWSKFARAIESAVHAKLSAPVEVGEAFKRHAVAWVVTNPVTGARGLWWDANQATDRNAGWIHDPLYPASLVEQQAREIAQQRLEIEGLRLQLLTAERGTQEAARAEVLYRQAEHLLTEPEKALTDRLSRQGEVIKRAAEAIENMKDCEFMGLDWSDLARNALAELRSVESDTLATTKGQQQ